MNRKVICLFAAALVTAMAAVAFAGENNAAASADVRGKVMTLLSGYEYVPTRGDFAKAGAGADAVLLELANDATQPAMYRARAISSLVHFPTDKVFDNLVKLSADTQALPLFRRKAVTAVGFAFQAKAIPTLQAALKDADPFVREAAIQRLAAIRDPKVLPVLKAHVEFEKKEFLQLELKRVIPAFEQSLQQIKKLKK